MVAPLRNVGLPSPGGVDFVEQIFAITAQQSLTNGDFVVLDAAGTISEATAQSAALLGRYKPDLTSGYGMVSLATTGARFLVKCNSAITAALVGDFVDLIVVSGEHQADTNAVAQASTKVFRIEEIVDAAAQLAYVSIVPAKSQAVDVEVNA